MGIGDNAIYAEIPMRLNFAHNDKSYRIVSIRSGGEHFVAIDGKNSMHAHIWQWILIDKLQTLVESGLGVDVKVVVSATFLCSTRKTSPQWVKTVAAAVLPRIRAIKVLRARNDVPHTARPRSWTLSSRTAMSPQWLLTMYRQCPRESSKWKDSSWLMSRALPQAAWPLDVSATSFNDNSAD